MVRRKQTVSKEHADVLRQWKQRGFLAPDFTYEELTSHYMEQLNKAAKNLAGSIYEEHHKGCRGITRIHRLPSRPSHPYGRQPHSLIFMSTLYKASSRLPASS